MHGASIIADNTIAIIDSDMTAFSLTTTILSLVILSGFVAYSVYRFGWRKSYSAFNLDWDKAVPMHNVHLWSIVTAVVALLMMPGLIELGEGRFLQCLGFFIPLYLAVVAIFPLEDIKDDDSEADIKEKERKKKIHAIAAIGCSAVSVVWIFFVMHIWWIALIAASAIAAAALLTKTAKKAYIFWPEMALFLTGFLARFLAISIL